MVATLPVLARVTVCVGAAVPTVVLANVSVLGVNVAVGEPAVALMLTDCGVPAASSVTEMAAERAPTAPVGLKVRLIVQVCPAATAVQLLVCENCPASVPVMETPLTLRVAPPVLVRVTTVGVAVGVPTGWAGTTTGFGLNETMAT